jgi:hypothetical protein
MTDMPRVLVVPGLPTLIATVLRSMSYRSVGWHPGCRRCRKADSAIFLRFIDQLLS